MKKRRTAFTARRLNLIKTKPPRFPKPWWFMKISWLINAHARYCFHR